MLAIHVEHRSTVFLAILKLQPTGVSKKGQHDTTVWVRFLVFSLYDTNNLVWRSDKTTTIFFFGTTGSVPFLSYFSTPIPDDDDDDDDDDDEDDDDDASINNSININNKIQLVRGIIVHESKDTNGDIYVATTFTSNKYPSLSLPNVIVLIIIIIIIIISHVVGHVGTTAVPWRVSKSH
jgi:hypothetical protein